jgi:hypothetical protein
MMPVRRSSVFLTTPKPSTHSRFNDDGELEGVTVVMRTHSVGFHGLVPRMVRASKSRATPHKPYRSGLSVISSYLGHPVSTLPPRRRKFPCSFIRDARGWAAGYSLDKRRKK